MTQALDLNKVSTLSTVLLTNLDEGIFFSKISEFVMNQFGEYKVEVFSASEDGSTQLRAVDGKLIKKGLTYTKGQGLSGYVTRMKRAYYSNSQRDPMLANTQRDAVVQSELCVPLICEDLIIGTIHIQSANADRKFGDEDVALVNETLSHLEAAIKNMRMYIIAKNLNKELARKIEEKEEELKNRGPVLKSSRGSKSKIEIIGHSNQITDVLNITKRVAAEDFPVLILGESGTGKKLLAKKIHTLSERKNSECITVHCSSIAEGQIELELFGTTERPGVLQRANGGTVILDDVEQLPVTIQSKLLRSLVSGEIFLTDSNIPTAINVRVISLTNTSLDNAVDEGTFREDLLYRLNIVGINMPNLASRQDDIKVLSEYFLNLGKKTEDYKILTNGAIEKLASYNWPGNIQELRNIMERTYILAEGKYVDISDLPSLVVEEKVEEVVVESFSEMTLHALEKKHICRTLDHLDGNKTRAAKVLGITVKTLYNKLHSYGLVHPKAE
jgi:Nif-specific regulatory protein